MGGEELWTRNLRRAASECCVDDFPQIIEAAHFYTKTVARDEAGRYLPASFLFEMLAHGVTRRRDIRGAESLRVQPIQRRRESLCVLRRGLRGRLRASGNAHGKGC